METPSTSGSCIVSVDEELEEKSDMEGESVIIEVGFVSKHSPVTRSAMESS